ncbi:hypothetical protein ACIBHX_13250 [Nonomuraea sp. NPDC050536]|uniref:hypothetical protein n=1 Tax=Nonomuraea sp. NPDC050536 TaxID=3364366 RepID=UPI0037CAAA45
MMVWAVEAVGGEIRVAAGEPARSDVTVLTDPLALNAAIGEGGDDLPAVLARLA